MASSSEAVAVIGAPGQLGSDLVEELERSPFTPIPLSHADVEVRDRLSLRRALRDVDRLVAVINCAAFHRVDECEDDPQRAMDINGLGAFEVARAAAELDAVAVFISSDYVFSGDKSAPYAEGDVVSPVNMYGVSKAAGEMSTRLVSDKNVIIRISSVFGRAGSSGKGGNFIETILRKAREEGRVGVIDDVTMTPTFTRDAARAIVALLENGATGTFHASNEGHGSWYDLAKLAVELAGVDAEVERVASDSYPSKAKRPRFSALASERLPEMGIKQPTWQDAVERYLIEKGHIERSERRSGSIAPSKLGRSS